MDLGTLEAPEPVSLVTDWWVGKDKAPMAAMGLGDKSRPWDIPLWCMQEALCLRWHLMACCGALGYAQLYPRRGSRVETRYQVDDV